MASNAIASMGARFYRWSADSSGWIAVAEISAIDGPSKTRETIEVTALDSEGGYREHIPSLREGGTVSLTMNYFRDTYDLMNEDFESNERQNYAIVLPDTDFTTLEFEGFVTELPLSISVGDKVTANVTIKVTGQPIIGDGSSDGPTANPS